MKQISLFGYILSVADWNRDIGRERNAETYESTYKSFYKYRKGRDIDMNKVDGDLLMGYQVWLLNRGLAMNTCSFYMKRLRAVFHRAEKSKLIKRTDAFADVFMGTQRTAKRALGREEMKAIHNADLKKNKRMEFARDMFMLSFYLRGMSFVDMSYLSQRNLNGGILTYRRRKTGQLISIRWTQCMQDIVDRYKIKGSRYLLPIIRGKKPKNDRMQYMGAMHRVNHSLKMLGKGLNLAIPLTMYCSRHSWATIARNQGVSVAIISQGLGHDNLRTTQVYLASLDAGVVDDANDVLIQLV